MHTALKFVTQRTNTTGSLSEMKLYGLLSLVMGCRAFIISHYGGSSVGLKHACTVREAGISQEAERSIEYPARRLVLSSLFSSVPLLLTATLVKAEEQKTVYLSGKTPKVPGQKAKDKNDYTGTRKDPNFLRSIADCKNQCENRAGPDGFVKTKEDCLSECQDICCTTYEQCTFAIVPRI